ncbi:MAG: ABC transporter permease [Alphaproteobacteria bacterium]
MEWLSGRRGTLISLTVLVVSILALVAVNPAPLGYFDISTISASATTLALAAMGETIVVLSGGLDLSAGAVVSLVNVVLVTQLGAAQMHPVLYGLAATGIGIGLGGAIGAVNGFFVGYLRLQPIIVTLATMFVAQGAALLILQYPGGEFDYDFSMVLVGDAVPGLLPAPILVLAVALVAWLVLRATRLGTAIYAVGSDASAAATNRVNVAATRFRTFTAAGAFYGAAGVFVTANSGAGDPLIGATMLLKVFAAVVLGGTLIGGGRGGAVGTVFGALTLTIIVNLFLVAGIRTYYVPIVEGLVLVLAVLGFEAGRGLPAVAALRQLVQSRAPRRRSRVTPAPSSVLTPAPLSAAMPSWLLRNAATLRFVLPAWLLLLIAMIATAVINGSDFSLGSYLVTLLVFTSFLAVLGVGQGAVVLAGGLDLSIAWAITFPAIVVTTYANGSDADAVWAMPLALAIGALIGLVNGILVVGARLSPIIATLATASVLEGIALVFSDGAPTGAAPPMLAWFVNGRLLGLPPVVYFLVVFVVVATLLLDRSAFGRRLHAVGMNAWVAKLSGVRTGAVIITAYVLSGLCAALVGLLLAGFTAQAYYDMGKPYLLSSIAVVVLGGTSITGGRGHYLGILGGALLFTALSSMLASTALPEAMRSIIYGLVLMGAVIMLREREQS